MTQLVVPHMAKQKDGIIINIGSIVGQSQRPLLSCSSSIKYNFPLGNIPTPWAGVYASSKAALHSYSEVLRMEVKVRSPAYFFFSLLNLHRKLIFGADYKLIGIGTRDQSLTGRSGSDHEWLWKETIE